MTGPISVACPDCSVTVNGDAPDPLQLIDTFGRICVSPTCGSAPSSSAQFSTTVYAKANRDPEIRPGDPPNNDPAKNLNCVAFQAVNAAYPQTSSQTLEYGGFIVRKPDQTYYSTTAFAGSQISMGSNFYTQYNNLVLSLQKGSSVAGWYHDHPIGPPRYDPDTCLTVIVVQPITLEDQASYSLQLASFGVSILAAGR